VPVRAHPAVTNRATAGSFGPHDPHGNALPCRVGDNVGGAA
jgi:hypothetical protein